MLMDIKSTLRVVDTLDPLIFMSDRTHLSNYAGDLKEWLVYMTIGNLSSKIRQMPTTHSVIMVALCRFQSRSRIFCRSILMSCGKQTEW